MMIKIVFDGFDFVTGTIPCYFLNGLINVIGGGFEGTKAIDLRRYNTSVQVRGSETGSV